MELQCKERVDLLDALRQSRKQAEREEKKSSKDLSREEKRTSKEDSLRRRMKAPMDSPIDTPLSGWIGDGTIPASNYPDLLKPAPPLPARPSLLSKKSSDMVTQRSRSVPQITVPAGLPAPPTLAVPTKTTSRSPSPDKKRPMLTTLRSRDGRTSTLRSARISSGRRADKPAASKAAGMAWDTQSKSPASLSTTRLSAPSPRRSTDLQSHRNSFTREPGSRNADEYRPSSDEEANRVSTLPASSPSDVLPSSSWREPQAPSIPSDNLDPSFRSLSLVDLSGPGTDDLIDLGSPPTPPPHTMEMKEPALSKPRTRSPLRLPKPPEISYRREYPPTSAAPRLNPNSILVNNKNATRASRSTDAPLRRPVANSSTPRANRRGRPVTEPNSTSSSGEERSRADDSPPLQRPTRKRREALKETTKASTPPSTDTESPNFSTELLEWDRRVEYLMKNLPRGVDEMAAKQIFNEIVVKGDEVHWDDVAGLEVAKKALKEAVVYPFLRPDLFMGLREPARGMLLFGPPGTGKTMLARAVATESKSTFFAISASSLTSKWHGESEKLVRALFALAKALAPSIIFVDEIDSLLSSRSSSSEHEASRRSKTEFLIQWSDLQRAAAGRDQTDKEKKEGDATRVLVLAASNVPWDIDEAARRRFVRRQYIPLPEDNTRRTQLQTLLGHQKHVLSKKDLEVLVHVTDGTPLSHCGSGLLCRSC